MGMVITEIFPEYLLFLFLLPSMENVCLDFDKDWINLDDALISFI